MLSRRYLRIKAMQALYAFFQSDNRDMGKAENEMFSSINKMYDLYISLLALLVEIHEFSMRTQLDAKLKRLPSQSDLNPNTKFTENPVLKKIASNIQLKREIDARKISWQTQSELVRKIYLEIKNSSEYNAYMSNEENSYKKHRSFITSVYEKFIIEAELADYILDERNIFWAHDLDFVHSIVLRTLQTIDEKDDDHFKLSSLYKDFEEDKQFTTDLFRKTIINNQEYEKLIADKTKNWDVERIALMDVLLMKMTIAEILNFQTIPIKVSLNEYIEISKLYSTPKSKLFINGILDKLVLDFKDQNRIKKIGRGLME